MKAWNPAHFVEGELDLELGFLELQSNRANFISATKRLTGITRIPIVARRLMGVASRRRGESCTAHSTLVGPDVVFVVGGDRHGRGFFHVEDEGELGGGRHCAEKAAIEEGNVCPR